jgi:RNA polymerase sigma-70 factor (ECF subfamily)
VPTSDAELARQALAGSQAAYSALVGKYASSAVNVAARLVNDRALAEELTQEAFVRAFSRLATYDPERRFSSWFFQILHNVSVDYLRRRRVETVSLDGLVSSGYAGPADDDPASSPEAETERRALAAVLADALGHLRQDFREAIVLKYQQGLSIDEIAEILEVPEGTVKTYLHRGRRELAAVLSAAGWGPRNR